MPLRSRVEEWRDSQPPFQKGCGCVALVGLGFFCLAMMGGHMMGTTSGRQRERQRTLASEGPRCWFRLPALSFAGWWGIGWFGSGVSSFPQSRAFVVGECHTSDGLRSSRRWALRGGFPKTTDRSTANSGEPPVWKSALSQCSICANFITR
jgi:hypothetical protein